MSNLNEHNNIFYNYFSNLYDKFNFKKFIYIFHIIEAVVYSNFKYFILNTYIYFNFLKQFLVDNLYFQILKK